ncbi:DNA-binding FrmR family transcriptional regulator [Paraburkholderia sp. CI2]|nr:DNA-binding FrmR family transcriptional regulator [Paraburkholderia sp. CI2]
MSHTIREKQKFLNRVRRIKGQVESIERALEEERGCIDVLQQITSCVFHAKRTAIRRQSES